ncbi:MAG TPA: NAD(P)/FAD-dependent oxidoreductase [Candidatus Acidoferrales bacterium]|nr:NAD(P)/FAD-dependent oxidoreductase [Candidatus Acidoferrales bacterium]
MRDEYDVVVVGAGPGGSAAARVAAQECETLLIEKRQEIGDPVRCAEALPGGVLMEIVGLRNMKKRWISSEIKGARFHAPDGTTVDVTSEMFRMEEPLGYILERKIFDRDLAKEAARAGAHVMVRTRATGLIIEDGAVKGVKMNSLGDDFEVRSKVVIGADGIESQVGRLGGINTALKINDIESCAQYHMENVEVSEHMLDFYFGEKYAPGGYAWVFPKGGHAANIGLGALGSKLNGRRPVNYLNEFVADKFQGGQQIELVVGGVPVSDALKTFVSDGLMLVGDAAHHSEPLTGAGITLALASGQAAGEVARKAVREKDASVRVLREYETEWNNNPYGKQRKRLYNAKEFLVERSDEELNRIIRVFRGLQPEELTLKGITTRILKKDPKLMLMIRHLL